MLPFLDGNADESVTSSFALASDTGLPSTQIQSSRHKISLVFTDLLVNINIAVTFTFVSSSTILSVHPLSLDPWYYERQDRFPQSPPSCLLGATNTARRPHCYQRSQKFLSVATSGEDFLALTH